MTLPDSNSCYITEVNVWDVEKRYKPSKHYVYCIWVFWSDDRKQLIFRRYSEFFDLQCKLLDRFKAESGLYDPSQRILPFLPGKVIFGRSHIKSVALDRLHPINLYCKKLITLKKEISRSDLVLKFFELNNEDISQSSNRQKLTVKDEPNKARNSPATISKPFKPEEYVCVHNYKPLSKTELNLRKGTKVFVIEKNLNGWWFVDSPNEGQGYVPKCVLKQAAKEVNSDDEDDAPILTDKNERFIATRDYMPRKPDELEMKKGEYMDVLEKSLNGWWRVKLNDRTGKVPAVYLKRFEASDPVKSAMNAWELFGTNEDYVPPRRDFIDTKSMTTCSSDEFSLSRGQSESNLSVLAPQSREEVYFVVQDYEDTVGDGIRKLRQGEKVVVLDKENSTGWWYVKLDDATQGWAPCAFLAKDKPMKPPRPPKPRLSSASSSDIIETKWNNVPHDNLGFMTDMTSSHNNHTNQNNHINQNFNSTDNTVSINKTIASNDDNSTDETVEYKPVKVSELRKKFENLK